MQAFWQDLRFGFRNLLRKPAFTAAALLSIVLGIGANTAIFTLLNSIFLNPLPIADPGSTVAVYITLKNESGEYVGFRGMSYLNYLDFRDRQQSLTDLALYQWTQLNLAGGSEPERVTGTYASGNYFDVLGIEPAHGRFFTPAEASAPGTEAVVVLSHGCWTRLFHRDPEVLGRSVSINGHPFTVVGVAPRGFKGTTFEASVDAWIPITMFPVLSPWAEYFDVRSVSLFRGIGRRQPGVAVETVASDMMQIAGQLVAEYPEKLEGMGATALPLLASTVAPTDRDRYTGYGKTLAVAVALILLITCINVANLLLVRGVERRREMAVRQAMGAQRRRIVRQLLTETLILFLIGGALSLPVARWTLSILWSFRPPNIAADALELGFGLAVIAFAFLVTLVSSLLFGLFPALRTSHPDLVTSLKDAGDASGSAGLRWWRPRSLLVISQVALALVTLVGAGLYVSSLANARSIDLGFAQENLIAMTLTPGDQGYEEEPAREFYRRALERIESLPAVTAATLTENRLLRGGVIQRQVFAEGKDLASEIGSRDAHRTNVVVPGYFAAVGIPLLQGRDFDDTIRADGPAVAIINKTMAEQLWPGEDPIGRRFHFDYPTEPLVEVIGMAADAKYRQIHEPAQFFIYQPLAQRFVSSMTLHVRSAIEPAALLPELRREILAIDPNMPLADVATMQSFIDNALWLERASAALLVIFGLLALLLAAVGIYGVVSYSVEQRRREMGIRMSLGALGSDVLRSVLREVVQLVAIGLVVGLGLAYFGLKPLVESQLVEVSAGDLRVYIVQSLVLLAVALLGSLVPALRATRTDVMRVLREE